jgi:hypothetical protein
MIRAAKLDVSLYEEVEADQNATTQAAMVVGIVAICGLISGLILLAGVGALAPAGVPRPSAAGLIVSGLIQPFISWVVYAYVTYFVGTNLFKGNATPGELLRAMGFAQSPGVLSILVFIPVLGVIVAIVLFFWILVAAIIAIRQALDISTGQAVVVGIIDLVVVIIISLILGAIGLGGVAP